MTNSINKTSLGTAALVAGLGLLIMVVAAPFAELYVYPKLVISNNAAETAKNIITHEALFVSGMFGYLTTFICDVVVAWALYVLMKPMNDNLSLLTALFRLIYAVIAIVALLNLVTVYNLTAFEPNQMYDQIMFSLNSFKNEFHFGLIFFSIHLLLLGYFVFKSDYIPKILGVLLIITGLGYLLTSLKPFLFPNVNIDFAVYTFYGELVFMLWLIIKGSRLKEPIS